MVENLPAMWETQAQSLGQEDPLEEDMTNLLQYPCLENPMDRGAWCATLHGGTDGQTQLNDYFHFHFHLIQLGDQSLSITSALFLVLL